jgi:hypothetical protein
MSSISRIVSSATMPCTDIRALDVPDRPNIVSRWVSAMLLLAVMTIGCSAPPAPPAPKADPVANAGPAQTVQLGETVLLDASGSSDPHSEPLSYSWSAHGDNPAPIVLTQSPQIQFTPTVPGIYRFALAILAGERLSLVDSVSVTVLSLNNGPPVVEAGPNLSYSIDAALFLDGSATTDPDDDALSFHWEPSVAAGRLRSKTRPQSRRDLPPLPRAATGFA